MKKVLSILFLLSFALAVFLLDACRDEASDLKGSLDEAQRALNLSDFGRAQRIYYELKQKFPEEQKIRLGLGYCYLKQNHDEYAGGEFSKVLALSQQTNGWAWMGLGTYYQRLRKPEEARICFENAVFCMPNSKEALCNLGNAYFRAANYEKAAESYVKALKAGDTRGELLAVIGTCHQRTKNWREAVRYFEKAFQELPKNKNLPLSLARIYKDNFDDPVKAADFFKKYAELDPKGAQALYSSFSVPEKNVETEPEKQEGAPAVTIVDKPEDDPKEQLTPAQKAKSEADTFEHDGRLARLDGKMKEAIKNYEAALKIDPSRGYLYEELGDIYSGEFQDDELLSALRSYKAYADWCRKDSQKFAAANQKVKEIQTRYNQAESKIRQMKEKEEEAKALAKKEEEERKKALEKDVEAKMAKTKSYDQLITEGVVALQRQQYVEARELLQKALAANEEDHRAYYYLGLVTFSLVKTSEEPAFKLEKCQEAIQFFSNAIERKKNYANSYALRGICYEMTGQLDKAADDYLTYLESVDENEDSSLKRQVNTRYDRMMGAH